ncbi:MULTISPECIES: anti-sigma factor [unclassified Pseudofrankia]|uniref:anti-sigma factor family protein n=1 Tax=unclassified Pseudofrankia TaxID=2994372 RepID=UPI0008D8FB6F|nr:MULTISPECIES: zf-HC2 domain-containing protein [unclassified Pseudofrankia]MDT3444130.1 zf-HC2 domain-containing protein [Pseudofrankia sp. BMG5.37]OHV44441.1 hypothetical protein BCD48_02635 [Pseudofrankia sp. BMG5.36]
MGPDARGEPMPRHPDGELLDAYADGERTPASVDRHVRACADCQRAVVALRNVRVELSRLAPITMPPDVARRIQATLSAAPTPAAPRPDRAGPDDSRDRHAGRRAPGRVRRPPTHSAAARQLTAPPARSQVLPRSVRPERLALLAACLLVVVAGAGLFVVWGHDSASSDRYAASSADMSAADSAAGAGAATPASGERALAPTAQALFADNLIDVADSGAVLGPDAVAQHAKDLLAGRIPVAGHTSLDMTVVADGTATGGTAAWQAVVTPDLLGCYEKLATSVGAVLAIDRVSYRGRDAVLVVLDIQDVPDTSGTPSVPATSGMGPAAQGGAVAAAPGAVPPSRDRVQLTVVDLGCDVSHLAGSTWYAATATRA